MKDHCKILNEIIEAYYDNEYPEYFQDDVYQIFEREDITDGYKAEPIKRGRWIVLHGVLAGDVIYGDMGECSNCGLHLRNWEWNYCPNCGARMDEVENGNTD